MNHHTLDPVLNPDGRWRFPGVCNSDTFGTLSVKAQTKQDAIRRAETMLAEGHAFRRIWGDATRSGW